MERLCLFWQQTRSAAHDAFMRPALKSPGYKTTPGEPGFEVPAAAKAPFTGRHS